MGPRIGRQLEELGVKSALDLKRLDPATVKAKWSVVLERTVRELNGLACSDLAPDPPPKQQIACTRSFGHAVTDITDLQEAITEFACLGAEKLRAQGGRAAMVLVFIRTSPFRVQDRQYGRSATVPLRLPSSDSKRIVAAALSGLELIYRPGFNYAKAGVILVDIHTEAAPQQELDLGDQERQRDERQQRLMQTLDAVNARYGRGTLRLGTARIHRGRESAAAAWQMRQERRSPRYTTHWNELMAVR